MKEATKMKSLRKLNPKKINAIKGVAAGTKKGMRNEKAAIIVTVAGAKIKIESEETEAGAETNTIKITATGTETEAEIGTNLNTCLKNTRPNKI